MHNPHIKYKDDGYIPPCANDTETWFSTNPGAIYKAIDICHSECKIRKQCLTEALSYAVVSGEYVHGVWGGTHAEQRRKMIEKMEEEGKINGKYFSV